MDQYHHAKIRERNRFPFFTLAKIFYCEHPYDLRYCFKFSRKTGRRSVLQRRIVEVL